MDGAVQINRRGACPALAMPMQTGDGLLARLNPVSEGLSPKQLIGLCESAERHGNGIMEITARGSIQIRGLSAASSLDLAEDVNALSIDVQTGPVVAAGPLAGLDGTELADPRPLASLIRAKIGQRGLATRLAPKVSVVINGSGIWRLDGLQADVRCQALDAALWRVEIASDERIARPIGVFNMAQAAEAAMQTLEELARLGGTARARDLPGPPPEAREAAKPVPLGIIELDKGSQAVAIALPFGSVTAATLAAFISETRALGARQFRPAAPRSLIVMLDRSNADAVLELAIRHGFITDASDPAMRVFACSGAPACTFGHFETRETANELVHAAPALFADGSVSLHVSGCAKGCAHPSSTTLTLVGDEKSVGIVVAGTARSLPLVHCSRKPLADALARLAARIAGQRSSAAALAELGKKELSAIFRQGDE